MPIRDLFLRCLLSAVFAITVCTPSLSRAQDEEEEEETSETATEVPAPRRTGTGAPPESWLAMGLALGLGAATIAVGAIVGRLALDENLIALDPRSTQVVAQSHHRTAVDFALVSTVTLTIGAIMFGIGAVWAIVLPFSTPPGGPAVQARIAPGSIGLEGTF